MMKRIMAIGMTMVMLVAGNLTRAEDCGIANPSFEFGDDGWSFDMNDGKFMWDIDVDLDFGSDGFYVLTLQTDKAQFHDGDMAIVSQAEPVDLSTITRITFDVKLATRSGSIKWDPNVCSAVMLIDGDVVWESNSVGPDARGEYYDEFFAVDRKYQTPEPHILSLGMRMNQDVSFPFEKVYTTQWDMVDCNLCPGVGLVRGDMSGDCYVDMNDLRMLAGLWLAAVDPNDPNNLSHVGDDPNGSGGTIDFLDYALYAGGDPNFAGIEDLTGNWLESVPLDYEYNLFEGDDILPGGVIDFYDFAVLGDAWMKISFIDVNDVNEP